MKLIKYFRSGLKSSMWEPSTPLPYTSSGKQSKELYFCLTSPSSLDVKNLFLSWNLKRKIATSFFSCSICEVCGSYQCPYCPFYSSGKIIKHKTTFLINLNNTFSLPFYQFSVFTIAPIFQGQPLPPASSSSSPPSSSPSPPPSPSPPS